MIKKRYLGAIIAAAIMTVVITAITILPNIRSTAHLKVDYIPRTIMDLQDNSDLIVVGTYIKVNKIIEDEGIKFYISELEINEIIQGKVEKKNVQLLQTYSYEDPLISNQNQVLLFLERYSGPLTNDKDTYVCKGLGYGQYAVTDNVVSAVYAGNDLLSGIQSTNGQTSGSKSGNGSIAFGTLIDYLNENAEKK